MFSHLYRQGPLRTVALLGWFGAAAAQEPFASGPAEIRVGALAHDVGAFGDSTEKGINANLELLLHSPEFLSGIGSPRPFVGTSINSAGDTSQLYLGLDWGWDLSANTFVAFQFGGAFHNGENDELDLSRKELGCSLLFRLGLEAGYRFNRQHALMLHLDHISNADLCEHNDGLETFGVRYGYSF